MDAALKFFIVVGLAALIVAANISLVRVIANWWQGGSLAIGSFVVVQPPKDMHKLNESLGQLLYAELQKTVSQIRRITLFANSPGALTISQPPIQQTDLSIKIGSVEVSGLVSWFHSLFVSEKTLNFVVSFDKNTALIASDISMLSKRQPYLHFEIADPTPRKISSRLAYALYQAQMTESDNSEATVLDPTDFELVIEALAAVQELDRQAGRKLVISPEQYAPHLDKIRSVTKKTPNWRGLVEAQAGLAFAAHHYDEARQIYAKFLEIPDLPREARQRYQMQMDRLKEFSLAAAPAAVLLRPNISTLDANKLQELQDAFNQLYQDNTNNGYKFIAGIYPRYAQLRSPIEPDRQLMYLGWHRAYLAYFETALRRVNPALSLPYWDWALSPALPEAVRASRGNPLAGGPLRLVSADGKVLEERQTTRDIAFSKLRAEFVPTGSRLADLLSIDNVTRFESEVWMYHNNVHLEIGGDMAKIESAAFDPLFWFLEANVDRLWALWQATNGGIKISDTVLNQKLEPFGKTIRDVLSTEKLGYKY